MKKFLSALLSIAIFLTIIPIGVAADTKTGIWTYSISGEDAFIRECDKTVSGTVTIPKEIDGYTVVDISSNAFYGCKDITAFVVEDGSIYNAINGVLYKTSLFIDADGNDSNGLAMIAYPAAKADKTFVTPENALTVFFNITNRYLETITLSKNVYGFSAVSTGGNINYLPSLKEINVSTENTKMYSTNGVLFGRNGTFDAAGNENKDNTLVTYPCKNADLSYTVPEEIVTIGANAFAFNNNLKTLTLTDSINNIGKNAFRGCSSLADIIIPEAFMNLTAEMLVNTAIYKNTSNWQNGALYYNDYLLGFNPDTIGETLVIKDGTTTISNCAFKGCSKIKEITVPNSVKKIGSETFSWCDNLTAINIEEGIENIGDKAFSNCIALTNAEIPNSVITLGDAAFSGCISLKNVKIGGRLTSISNEAFKNCVSLTSISIPENIKSFENNVFAGCAMLETVTIPSGISNIDKNDFTGTAVYSKSKENGIVTISGYLICADKNISGEITVKDGTTDICNNAFEYCSGLKKVSLPDTLINIGNDAFKNCPITSVIIPSSVKNLGDSIFSGCRSLTDITVKEGNEYYTSEDGVLYTKDKTALIKCPENKQGDFTVPNTVTEMRINSVETINLEKINLPSSLKNDSINIKACPNLKEINVDSENEKFSSLNGILYNKNQTDLIRIPQNYEGAISIAPLVETILSNAGLGCKGIESLNNLVNVKKIGNNAFVDCESLSSVIFSDSLVEIGENAFSNTALTSVNLPASVVSVSNAFSNCAKLISINVNDANMNYSSLDGVLYNNDKTELVFYPCMKETTDFSIPSSVEIIVDYAFSNAKKLINIELSDNLKSIGNYAFLNCSALKTVNIGNSVESIGFKAFCNCTSLESIIIPDSVTYLNSYIFKDCTALSNVTIGSGIFYIPCGMFSGCISLGSVNIPSNITIICSEAFLGCGMTEVSIPYTVETVEENAFGYRRSSDSFSIEKIDDFIIKCYDESAGKDYADKNSFTSEILPDGDRPLRKTLLDETSGIEIKYNSAFEDGVTLNVNRIYDGTSFTIIGKELEAVNSAVYDINVLKDDKKVQPDGAVTVRIPIPENFDANNLVICYINNETQTLEILPMTVVDGYAVFKTTHFSYYAIVQLSAGNVTGVSIKDTTVKFKKSITLTPIITSDPGAKYTVRYESSNPKVVSVDNNGKITGNRRGKATITCTVTDANGNSVTDTCAVTVKATFLQIFIDMIFLWFRLF